MTRRLRTLAAVAALSSALTACGGATDNSDILQMGKILIQQSGWFGSNAITRERAASVPYASIGIRLGSSAEALLVLATASGDTENWQAGTEIAISTRFGRVVKTVGFDHDLNGFQGPVADSAAAPPERGGPYHFTIDLADMGKYGVLVRCRQEDTGTETLTIIGVVHETRHVVETCRSKELDWDFTNEFWRDPQTGYVWKSIQNVRPDIDAITIETLRPEK